MSNLRIFDIIATKFGDELVNGRPVNITEKQEIYNPNNLGGGYSRDDAGNLSYTNETISFQMIFQSDVDSTGYEKYMSVTTELASKEVVWLRYAVPTPSRQTKLGLDAANYVYAYRPGYISSMTKTEASYANQSLVETISITTLDSWFILYRFNKWDAERGLHPQNATNYPSYYAFSKTPKKHPYNHPYWYGDITPPVPSGDWYAMPNTNNTFLVHAPSPTVSDFEKDALTSFGEQLNNIRGNSFASNPQNKGLFDQGQHHNFKATIENYASIDVPDIVGGPYAGTYTSYLVSGTTQQGGSVAIQTDSSVTMSELKFTQSGRFLIDTAPWANTYKITYNTSDAGSEGINTGLYIDFSRFTKTTVAFSERIVGLSGADIENIIVRRPIFGI